jgi:hypothetical protein
MCCAVSASVSFCPSCFLGLMHLQLIGCFVRERELRLSLFIACFLGVPPFVSCGVCVHILGCVCMLLSTVRLMFFCSTTIESITSSAVCHPTHCDIHTVSKVPPRLLLVQCISFFICLSDPEPFSGTTWACAHPMVASKQWLRCSQVCGVCSHVCARRMAAPSMSRLQVMRQAVCVCVCVCMH